MSWRCAVFGHRFRPVLDDPHAPHPRTIGSGCQRCEHVQISPGHLHMDRCHGGCDRFTPWGSTCSDCAERIRQAESRRTCALECGNEVLFGHLICSRCISICNQALERQNRDA